MAGAHGQIALGKDAKENIFVELLRASVTFEHCTLNKALAWSLGKQTRLLQIGSSKHLWWTVTKSFRFGENQPLFEPPTLAVLTIKRAW